MSMCNKVNEVIMADAKRKIAWFIPPLSKGSGGLNTIFRNAEALSSNGYTCDFYFPPSQGLVTNKADTLQQMRDWFGYTEPGDIYLFEIECQKDYDLIIATFWDTAYLVALQKCNHKAYFIQDWEPSFYPVSDAACEAEFSYQLGLSPITIGKWLANKLDSKGFGPSFYTDFGADLSIYKQLNITKEFAICAIYQPDKPRRIPNTIIEALQIVKIYHPDLTIYLYGSQAIEVAGFNHLGILSKPECNLLYNRCLLGISASTTNPSRIPFEMMAAGLPVLELAGDNTEYDLPKDAVELANPNSISIAASINELLASPERLEQMRSAGPEFMSSRPLQLEMSQFVDACNSILDNHKGITLQPYKDESVFSAEQKIASEIYLDRCRNAKKEFEPHQITKSFHLALTASNSYKEIQVAIWPGNSQSNILWKMLAVDPSAKWGADIMLDSLSSSIQRYNFHFYGLSQQDALQGVTQPHFLFSTELGLYSLSDSRIPNEAPKEIIKPISNGLIMQLSMKEAKEDLAQESSSTTINTSLVYKRNLVIRLKNLIKHFRK